MTTKRKARYGEHGFTRVLQSDVTGELYVAFILKADTEFRRGEKVEVGVVAREIGGGGDEAAR